MVGWLQLNWHRGPLVFRVQSCLLDQDTQSQSRVLGQDAQSQGCALDQGTKSRAWPGCKVALLSALCWARLCALLCCCCVVLVLASLQCHCYAAPLLWCRHLPLPVPCCIPACMPATWPHGRQCPLQCALPAATQGQRVWLRHRRRCRGECGVWTFQDLSFPLKRKGLTCRLPEGAMQDAWRLPDPLVAGSHKQGRTHAMCDACSIPELTWVLGSGATHTHARAKVLTQNSSRVVFSSRVQMHRGTQPTG